MAKSQFDIESHATKETSRSSDTAQNVVKRRQLPLEAMATHDEVLQTAYQYWEAKREGGLLPARSGIDVLEIATLIKYTHLVDVQNPDPNEWRFRVVGSIVPQTWEWGTGQDKLSDCPWPPYLEMLIQDYGTVKSTGVPMYHEISIRVDWVNYQYSRVVLPFAPDGRQVDTLMSCVFHRETPDLKI